MENDMTEQQKRSFEEATSILEDVKVLILDIEGTTTPFTFVKENLFPYIKNNIETYLTTNYDQDETKEDIKCLRELACTDKTDGKEVTEIPEAKDDNKDDVIKAVMSNVLAQMDEDRKTTALKQFQGHMWREAYKSNDVVGELFEDVNPVLSQLNEEGYKLYIYSSGSKEAQELLFQYSIDGDIRELFSGFYDTTIGPKKEAASYKKIKEDIESSTKSTYKSEEILFLTDDPAEAKAAREACLQVVIVDRSIEQEGGIGICRWQNIKTGQAKAAREACLQVVIVDRSIEQEGGIDIDPETRKNFPVIESLNDLFGEDDDDDEEFGQVKRAHMAGNGEFDDEDDEDDVDDDDDDVVDDDGAVDDVDDDGEEEEEGE